jgi:hypothetical protein
MAIPDPILARLASQVSRAEPILFTGAGFSCSSFDADGKALPTGGQLTRELWTLAFRDQPFIEGTRLGDAFFAARNTGERALRAFLTSRLSVRADRLPDHYRDWFSMPWRRCYTLNIDDLEIAVSNKFRLPRPIRSISATSGKMQGSSDPDALEVIHLNGAIWDDSDDLTFSPLDYGSRLATPDSWYIKCSADIVSRPLVVVGTELDESPLWQYLELRKSRGPRGLRELRPGSALVTPTVNPARAIVLRELNIDWLALTAEQFHAVAFPALRAAAEAGHATLRSALQTDRRRSLPALVSDLAAAAGPTQTEYLMGHEPTWADLKSGRAIEREFDDAIYAAAKSVLVSALPGAPIAITGTAGAGKSTSLMRLGLRLAAEGVPCYWLDERSNVEPHLLRTAVTRHSGPIAILIDDADLWGRTLSTWARELPTTRPQILFIAALRSSRVDHLLDEETLAGVELRELAMPRLTDLDIERLIRVLDDNNRLGVLKGKSHDERVEAFRQETGAGRQLLVAMIQATSGERFRERAFEEFRELSGRQQIIYAFVCFVHFRRFSLDREELLLASGVPDNETLNAIETLVTRHLVVRDDTHSGYRARHRVIAEEVVQSPEFGPLLPQVLDGVCFAFANRVSPTMPRTARPWRRLARFISHDFLLRHIERDVARAIYERLEAVLDWDSHYWLQRGSFELETGGLEAATQFLNQARSLKPNDRYVETEYGYLLIKKAAHAGHGTYSRELFDEGFALLEALIREHGQSTPYPYDVIARQTLAWIDAVQLPRADSRPILQKLVDLLEEAVRRYPGQDTFRVLLDRVRRAWLETAVAPPGRTS